MLQLQSLVEREKQSGAAGGGQRDNEGGSPRSDVDEENTPQVGGREKMKAAGGSLVEREKTVPAVIKTAEMKREKHNEKMETRGGRWRGRGELRFHIIASFLFYLTYSEQRRWMFGRIR